MKRRPSYRSLEEDPSYEHPADQAVRLRVGRQDLARKAADASTAIVKALGAKRRLWFRYEQAADQMRALREAAYFDVGVSHGFAACSANELRTKRAGIERLAWDLIRRAMGSGLARQDAAAAATMTAWSLLGGTAAREGKRRGR